MSITIENANVLNSKVYFCIFGDEDQQEDWVEMQLGETIEFDLDEGVYKIKLCSKKNQMNNSNLIYEVQVPGEYFIDNDLAICDTSTSDAMPLCSKFKSISLETKKSVTPSNKSSIQIENRFPYEIFVRVTDQDDYDFIHIFPNETETIETLSSQKCHIEYSLSPIELSGFMVEVMTGQDYLIDENFYLKIKNGGQKPQSNQISYSDEKKNVTNQSGVTVKNGSNFVVKVRISAQGGGSENWVNILPKSSEFFPRNSGHSYHMQFSLNENTSGPTVNVRSNETYTISSDFRVQDSQGNFALFSSEEFRASDQNETQIEQNQTKDIIPTDYIKIFLQHSIVPVRDVIALINNTDHEVQARVAKRNIGAEDYFKISPHKTDTWKREEGTFISSILISGKESNFYLRTNSAYIIYPNNVVIDFDGNKIPLTNDSFNSSKQKNNASSQMLFQVIPDAITIHLINNTYEQINVRIQRKVNGSEDYFAIPFQKRDSWRREPGYKFIMEIFQGNKLIRFYVQTQNVYQLQPDYSLIDIHGNTISPTQDIFQNYSNNNNNNSISQNNAVQNKIKIKNNSSSEIYVRIKAGLISGSEDLFAIAKAAEDTWTRPGGKYLIEIALDKDHKYRYYIQSPNEYTFNSEKQLINNQTKEKISPTQDNTFAPSWMDGETKAPTVIIEPDVPYYKNIKPEISTGLFVDKTFPPETRIINSFDENGKKVKPHFGHAADEEFDEEGIEFKRPTQIWGNSYSLFKDKIEYDDVVQGQIGNCYLISVIASLAKRPNLIESLFKTRSASRNGFYEVYYYENGQKRVMFVDDNFVTRDDDFVYAKPNGSEIWVLLLEKAFAKYEGGFSNIEGGDPADPLKFFTGAITRDEYDLLKCWDELVAALKKGHICCAGSRSETGKTDQQKTKGGIYFGHAYSITDAKEYNNGKMRLRLIQLRNPWGQGEWKGDFSDNSSKWTPELISYFKLDECKGEDGRFWMPVENFAQEFDVVTICYC